MSASYIDLHIKIDNGGRLNKKSPNNVMTFPIANFKFISSNIPTAPAYGVYISKPLRYHRACVQYNDLLDIA